MERVECPPPPGTAVKARGEDEYAARRNNLIQSIAKISSEIESDVHGPRAARSCPRAADRRAGCPERPEPRPGLPNEWAMRRCNLAPGNVASGTPALREARTPGPASYAIGCPEQPETLRKWDGSRPVSRVLSRAAIHLGRASPRASCDLPGSGAGHACRSPIWSCSGRGLPCHRCYHRRGALLPHLFTLTRARRAVYFLWHFPWARAPQALPGALPCGARTFLPAASRGAAAARPTPAAPVSASRLRSATGSQDRCRAIDAGASKALSLREERRKPLAQRLEGG